MCIHHTSDQELPSQRAAEVRGDGVKAGIRPQHAARLRNLLTALDVASAPGDMDAPGYNLHPLHGGLEDHWSIWVSGNWRITFAFELTDVILVDYLDYH
jgi:proteic killer suppression protein